MKLKRDLKGLKVTVLGLGKTGVCCSRFLLGLGAEVSLSDPGPGTEAIPADLADAGVKFFLGGECLIPLESADLAVASPGVPDYSPQIQRARENNVHVISEIELFSRFCRSPVIGVTGTNGKTTTTVLLSKLMNALGYETVPAGNIGIPLTGLERGHYDGSRPLVCEISSFQLEHTYSFRPFVSIVLNITPDHLDRYRSFDEYISAKCAMVAHQTGRDYAVLNGDCPVTREFARSTGARVVWIAGEESPGDCVWLDAGMIKGRLGERRIEVDAGPAGLINVYNAMAVAACAMIYGADSGVLSESLKSFRGLEHRREYATEISGVSFYNDSKATNASAFLDALRVFGDGIIAISGGSDKGIDYSCLRDEVSRRVKRMVLIGETARKLEECFKDAAACLKAGSLREAVRIAFGEASPGDKVVLLPGTSSFDMFADYEERGRLFKAEVSNLRKEMLIREALN